MSNDKTSKDFELDDLEKPLTEQEMKETIGGAITPELHAPVSIPEIAVPNSGGATKFTAGQFGYTATPSAPVIPVIFTPPPPPTPFSHSIPAAPKQSPIPTLPPIPNLGSGSVTIPRSSGPK